MTSLQEYNVTEAGLSGLEAQSRPEWQGITVIGANQMTILEVKTAVEESPVE